MNYNKAFERVVGHEGGFTDNPKDRGNWTSGKIGVGECKGTKYGISAMSYPHLDIRNLTLDDARAIYKQDFWDKIRGDEMPYEIAFNVFDGAVNSGLNRSIKWLQRAVGETEDGVIGRKTMLAIKVREKADTVARYNGQRLLFLADTPPSFWDEYGRGWCRRVGANLLT